MLMVQSEVQGLVEPTSFVRLEQKYLVPKTLRPQLEDLLANHSQPSFWEGPFDYNLIESTYYDSERLKAFTDHFQKNISRLKIRTRRYAPNGEWKRKSAFIEVKSKEDGISKKVRLRLPSSQVELLSQGKTICLTEKLVRKNNGLSIEEICERIVTLNALVKQFTLRPQVRLTYQRRAFEKDGFRVTVDDQVQYEVLRTIDPGTVNVIRTSDFWSRAEKMRDNFVRDEHLILELKHSGEVPMWMQNFLAAAEIDQTRFSKYCFAMTSTILGG